MLNIKTDNYKFCQNKDCEFFPCHDGIAEDAFNCTFCFCPLYTFDDCGGNYEILDNGIKDCSNCKIPHKKENYDYIVNKLTENV